MKKIKQTGSFFYEQFYHYLLYIRKHLLSAIFLFTGIWVSFGSFAFATDYYVDSEVVINIAGTNYNWLEIGRFGLVFVRRLLGTSWYNPYYTGILFLFFLWLTGMTFSCLCSKLFPKLTAPVLILGSLLFLTYPTFTEQYYFHFQSAEIAFGLWICMLSLGIFYFFVRDRRLSCFIVSLFTTFLIFAIYQSFVPLMLCGYLTIFLSIVIRKDTSDTVIKRGIWGSILHFVTAFALYELIEQCFFAESTYLSEQIIWASESYSLTTSVKTVLICCIRMLAGYDVFYTAVLPFAILFAAAALLHLRTLKPVRFILTSLSTIGIVLCPFLLTFLMGGNTATRSQFTYGFSACMLIFFAIQTFLEYPVVSKTHIPKTAKKFLTIPAVSTATLLLCMLMQIDTVRFIWDMHEEVAEFDRTTATALMETMYDSHIVDSNIGTTLWGSLQPDLEYEALLSRNPSYLFRSVFNLEHHIEPYCFYSTNRILGYMESMGHAFTFPTDASHGASKYIMNRENLTDFPEEGCYFNDIQCYTLNLGNCPEYYYN